MRRATILRDLEGNEVWTDAFGEKFGERVCVGIENGKIIHNGKRYTITQKEANDLWEDHIRNEFGSHEQMMKDAEEEFGEVVA